MVHRRHKDVIDRLARIEGHVHAVKRMVEEESDCPAVLLQMAAVRAAMDKVSQIIFEDHIETCVVSAVQDGEGEEAIQELKAAISRFF